MSAVDVLQDMGFFDQAKNERLLRKYQGDVNQCVNELLTDNNWHSNRHWERTSQSIYDFAFSAASGLHSVLYTDFHILLFLGVEFYLIAIRLENKELIYYISLE